MNRANRTAIAPWIIILVFAAFSIQAQQAKNPQSEQKPSLEDTETWIKQTFTDDNVGSSDCQEYDPERPGVNYGPYASCIYSRYEKITFAQCRVSFEIHHSTGGIGKGGFQEGPLDIKNDAIVSFSLSDIDPNTIKLNGLRGTYGSLDKKTFYHNDPWNVEVHFGTTNEVNTIAVEYPYGSTRAFLI